LFLCGSMYHVRTVIEDCVTLFLLTGIRLYIHKIVTITNSTLQSPSWEANSRSAAQEITAFYGNWRFITVFTKACHWSLSWARWILSTPSHFLLILSSQLRLGLPSGLLLSNFPITILYLFHARYIPHVILFDFITLIIRGSVELMKLLIRSKESVEVLDQVFSTFSRPRVAFILAYRLAGRKDANYPWYIM
jgi:hypothetical protein